MQTILVVDDKAGVRTLVREYLEQEGYRVCTAENGRDALYAARHEGPDLILLDIMMPEMGGYDFIRAYRKNHETPIILLTAKLDESDKVLGLELGADDYVTKPFGMRELVARIRAVLRRRAANDDASLEREESEKVIQRGKLEMDPMRHSSLWEGLPVTLTVTEFLILHALAQRPGFVKSRDQLMDAAYDDQVYVDDRTIDSHIKRIRKKFRDVDDEFNSIETLYGVGYRYREV